MSEVRLLVDGSDYSGWEQVSYTRSIEALAAQFSARVSDKRPFPVAPNMQATLLLDEEEILNGRIESTEKSISANQRRVTLSGRDMGGDLIDSGLEPSEFTNISFDELLGKLADPFGMRVSVRPTLDTFDKFSIQQGEKVFDAMERAARMRGVFINTTVGGDLIIDNYGAARADTSLVEGENIKDARLQHEFSQRFGEYIVRGQQPGTNNTSPEQAAGPEGRAQDPAITRHRPAYIQAEGNLNNKSAAQRAEWEATVRAARSVELKITVAGWRQQSTGRLWAVNELVAVNMPVFDIRQDMLIKSVTYTLANNTGFTTEIDLVRADAYQKKPVIPDEEIGGGFIQ